MSLLNPAKILTTINDFQVKISQILNLQQIHIIASDILKGFRYTNILLRQKDTKQYQQLKEIFPAFSSGDLEIQNGDKQISLIVKRNTKIVLLFKGKFQVRNKLASTKQNPPFQKKQQKIPIIQDDDGEDQILQSHAQDVPRQRNRILQKQALIDKNIETKCLQKKIYPYNCLCLLRSFFQVGESTRGTGCILTPFIILTCAHNLFHKQTKKYFKQMYAFFGDRKILIKDARYHPEYQNKLIRDENNENYDFAILLLDKPYILDRYMPISANFYKNLLAEIPGFPLKYYDKDGKEISNKQKPKQDQKVKNKNLISCGVYNLYGSKDMILSFEKDLMLYKITTNKGQSGSPILVQLYGGHYFIVGIHIASIAQQQRNAGVRLTNENVNLILKWWDELSTSFLFSNYQLSSWKYAKLAFRRINFIPYETIQMKEIHFSFIDTQYEQIEQIKDLQELIKQCSKPSVRIMNHGINIANYYQENLEYLEAIKILKKVVQIDQSKAQHSKQIMLMKAEIYYNLAIIYRKHQKSLEKHQANIPNYKYMYIKHNFYTNSRQFLLKAQSIYQSFQPKSSINLLKITAQKAYLRSYKDNQINNNHRSVIQNIITKIKDRLYDQESESMRQKLLIQLYNMYACFGQLLCENRKFLQGIEYYQLSLDTLLQIYEEPNRLFIQIYRKCFKSYFQIGSRSADFFKKGIQYGYSALAILRRNLMQNKKYGIRILSEYQECIKQMIKISKDKTDMMKAIQALKIIYQDNSLIKELEQKISYLE